MKILYVTTISSTTNFFVEHVKMLLEKGHTVDFACNITKPINASLISQGCQVFQIDFSRSPLSPSVLKSYGQISRLLKEQDYDIVHVHTPIAAAVTRLVCRKLPSITVMYTAHGFHFFKGAPLINWLLYYPIEKYLSKYTDVLITINKEDFARAKTKFRKTKHIEYVPGVGVDINKFSDVVIDRGLKRKEIGVPEDAFLLISVGELNKNKNHQIVIKALKELNNTNVHYIICGVGSMRDQLTQLIQKYGLEDQIKLLGYRQDIPELLKASDVFVFPSKREGLPVSLMEAMACGLPSVVTRIRGNVDLIEHRINGILCDPTKSDDFKEALSELFHNREKRLQMGKASLKKVDNYSNQFVIKRMDSIYIELETGIGSL